MPLSAKDQLKMLSSGKILSRDGRPSARNLAKPYKSPRLIIDKETGKSRLHPLDWQKCNVVIKDRITGKSRGVKVESDGSVNLSENESLVESHKLTNGSLGIVAFLGGSGVSHKPPVRSHIPNTDRQAQTVEKRGCPGRDRNGRKRRTPGWIRLPKEKEIVGSNIEQLVKIRNKILTCKWIAELTNSSLDSDILVVLEKIEGYLLVNAPKKALELDKRDKEVLSSIRGRIKAGQINRLVLPFYFLDEVEKAARILNKQ